jgi:hypothetical protein
MGKYQSDVPTYILHSTADQLVYGMLENLRREDEEGREMDAKIREIIGVATVGMTSWAEKAKKARLEIRRLHVANTLTKMFQKMVEGSVLPFENERSATLVELVALLDCFGVGGHADAEGIGTARLVQWGPHDGGAWRKKACGGPAWTAMVREMVGTHASRIPEERDEVFDRILVVCAELLVWYKVPALVPVLEEVGIAPDHIVRWLGAALAHGMWAITPHDKARALEQAEKLRPLAEIYADFARVVEVREDLKRQAEARAWEDAQEALEASKEACKG